MIINGIQTDAVTLQLEAAVRRVEQLAEDGTVTGIAQVRLVTAEAAMQNALVAWQRAVWNLWRVLHETEGRLQRPLAAETEIIGGEK